jgi:hypothetical protein
LATLLADGAAFIEIMAQPLRVSVRNCQSDVAVRPDQIERCAQEAGSPHSLLPCKKMEWKSKFGADISQAASQFSVHVNLPRQRSERGEVVFSRLNLDPGQAITASVFRYIRRKM